MQLSVKKKSLDTWMSFAVSTGRQELVEFLLENIPELTGCHLNTPLASCILRNGPAHVAGLLMEQPGLDVEAVLSEIEKTVARVPGAFEGPPSIPERVGVLFPLFSEQRKHELIDHPLMGPSPQALAYGLCLAMEQSLAPTFEHPRPPRL